MIKSRMYISILAIILRCDYCTMEQVWSLLGLGLIHTAISMLAFHCRCGCVPVYSHPTHSPVQTGSSSSQLKSVETAFYHARHTKKKKKNSLLFSADIVGTEHFCMV